MDYQFLISGTIGKKWDFWTGERGTVVSDVRDFLDKHKGEEVDIAICSPGGYVPDGLTIGQLIKDHGKVNCHILGMSASIATVLAMGAKTVTMAKGSLMLIHNSSTVVGEWTGANKEQLDEIIAKWQKTRKDLDTIDKVLASIYADKNGKSIEENLEKMKAAEWLSPEDALSFGLIDSIRDDEDDAKKSASLRKNIATNSITKLGLPPMPTAASSIVDANGEPTQTFIQKTVNALKSAFNVSPTATPNTNSTPMKKVFVALAAILAVDAFDFVEGKTSLTEDQVKLLDDKVAEMKNELAKAEDSKKEALKDLQAKLDSANESLRKANEQIENLKKSPAAPSAPQPSSPKDDDEIDFDNVTAAQMLNLVKDL